MNKLIVNKHTLEIARRQTISAFKKVYLELQKCLLHYFDWAGEDLEKKKYIKSKIEEVGQIYKETSQKLQKLTDNPKMTNEVAPWGAFGKRVNV